MKSYYVLTISSSNRKKLSNFSKHMNWKHAANYVCKRYIDEVSRKVYFDDVRLQMDAKLWGEEFNRHNPPKKVWWIVRITLSILIFYLFFIVWTTNSLSNTISVNGTLSCGNWIYCELKLLVCIMNFLGIHLKSSPITITQHGMLSHFWIWDGWMINLEMTWESFNFLGLKTLLVSEVFTDYVIVSLYFQWVVCL